MKTYLTKSPPAATAFSIQVVIICEVGYKFSDNSPQTAIDCGTTGKWSTTPDCIGTFLISILVGGGSDLIPICLIVIFRVIKVAHNIVLALFVIFIFISI